MTCLAYRAENCQEHYVDHVERALKTWGYLKKYYVGGVRRVFPVEGRVDLVDYVILTHDLGKLAAQYQRHRPGEYRHEVVSAYLTYQAAEDFPEEARLAAAAAVLLHHEPIILSQYVARRGERYLPVYAVRRALERSDLAYACGDDVIKYYESKSRRLGEALKSWKDSGIKPGDVVGVIKRLIVYTTVGDPTRLHVLRSKVAALLHPLVVSDSVAAYLGRKCGQEGTTVTKRALAGAEPIKEQELRGLLGL